ncbi:porin [Arcobacter sp. LA11]|uniref:porin n=1 Tax=Arcobacter sp. LA11 TaxID=1898176 RepID=UPI000932FB9E|nr:porin [Arcobacter sp. LA11]
MKKFAKMSLIAAIAVAGTTASAQPLAEAIKNVDVSGTATYRYNDYELSEANNNYKVAVSLKSKITDDVTFNSRFIAGDDTANVSLGTSTSGDGSVSVVLSEANFAYTGIANTAVVVGKQGLATAYTLSRDAMGDEQTGTGILAMTTFSPVTLYAGYFNQTNFKTSGDITGLISTGGEDLAIVGFMGTFGGISVDASYVDLQDTFDAYTLGLDASYKISSVDMSAFARYSSLDLDNADTDNNLWKIGVAANMGIFGAHLSYGQTDEEGGTVGVDASATTGFDEHWRVTLSGVADASVVYAGIDAQVTDKVKIALNYSDMEIDTSADDDQTEIYTQVSYKHASNLSTYVRFGQLDNEANPEKETMGRVHVQYSF